MSIRLADAADAGAVAAIYRPYVESTPISFEVEAPDASEMRARIESTLAMFPWLVEEQGGTVAGYAYATAHRTRRAYQWSVDTAVYIASPFHRRGVGRRLYEALFRVLVMQGFVNAYAGITLPNPASVGLHESVGFQACARYSKVGYKLGAWHDVGWWARELQPHSVDPAPPVAVSQIRSQLQWEDSR